MSEQFTNEYKKINEYLIPPIFEIFQLYNYHLHNKYIGKEFADITTQKAAEVHEIFKIQVREFFYKLENLRVNYNEYTRSLVLQMILLCSLFPSNFHSDDKNLYPQLCEFITEIIQTN
jgi:hypothetical protein